MFLVISVYFNLRNILTKSGTFPPGHSVYTVCVCVCVYTNTHTHTYRDVSVIVVFNDWKCHSDATSDSQSDVEPLLVPCYRS